MDASGGGVATPPPSSSAHRVLSKNSVCCPLPHCGYGACVSFSLGSWCMLCVLYVIMFTLTAFNNSLTAMVAYMRLFYFELRSKSRDSVNSCLLLAFTSKKYSRALKFLLAEHTPPPGASVEGVGQGRLQMV